MPKICIDAGHYGKYNRNADTNPIYYESLMAWSLHLKLKEELERYEGITVITTRKDQTKDLDVVSRGKKAKGCDLFLSLHSNWCVTESVDRAVVIYPINNKCKDLAQLLVNAIQATMALCDKSKIYSKLNSAGNADYYGVIRGAAAVGVPGLILEHSFHSHLLSAEWLLDEGNLRALAVEEAAVIAGYYGCKKKGDIDMTEQELKEFFNSSIDAALKANTEEIKTAVREEIMGELEKQLGPFIERIGDVPHKSVRKELRALLDCGAIDGGTVAADDPDDVRLPYSIVRAVVMGARFTKLCVGETGDP